MAPKTNCNATKLAAIVTYFQTSRSCHSLKDLEKQLPAAASISGMQVKDYLQSLTDDSLIRVEKIGSGNWYWSFASDDLSKAHSALASAQKTFDTLTLSLKDLREKVSLVTSEETPEETSSREDLETRKAIVESDLAALKKELLAFQDSDPVEMEKKEKEVREMRGEVESVTDDLYVLEGWFRKNSGQEAVEGLREEYGDQWDEEEEDWKVVE